jgi:hypothetical protein
MKNMRAGRPKGAPNKSTAHSREILERLLHSNLETLEADLKKLSPKDRINAVLTMAKFVLPVLKESTNSVNFQELIIPKINFTTNENIG